MAKTGDYDIPFDSKGNQLDYDESRYSWRSDVVRRPNFEFTDVLVYKEYGRGRSSATFTFNRSDGTTVSFFMSNMSEIIPHMVNGRIEGRFTFVKKGQNFSCRYLGPQ